MFQGDINFDWNDGSLIHESRPSNPIPCRPGAGLPSQHLNNDLNALSIQINLDDLNNTQQQIPVGRSLGSQWNTSGGSYNFNNCYDNYIQNSPQIYTDPLEGALSPLNTNSPQPWQTQSMDLESEIKLEPMEELDILGMINHPNTHDDFLFDDFSIDEFSSSHQMDTGTTTCLDPQHSSPAAMAAVRPNEVMGLGRGSSTPATSTPSASSFSLNQAIKIENSPLIPSSYPPHDALRDPFLNSSSSVPNHIQHQNVNHNIYLNDEKPDTSILFTQANPFQQQNIMQSHQQPQHQQQQINQQYNSTSGSCSALQELLLQSPSTPLSTSLSPQSVSSPQGIPSPHEESFGQSVPRPSPFSSNNPMLAARLSSSAPVHNFMDQAWQRREPRQHLLSTGSLAEEFGGSASSLSTGIDQNNSY